MTIARCTLSSILIGGSPVNLPVQFRYKPAAPVIRYNVVETAGDAVIQKAPAIIPADSLLAWTLQAATRAEWIQMLGWFRTLVGTQATFTGYWGENMVIQWLTMDSPNVQSGLFDLSGSFRLVTATSWGT